jgi:hypothetical protein
MLPCLANLCDTLGQSRELVMKFSIGFIPEPLLFGVQRSYPNPLIELGIGGFQLTA